MKQVVNIIFNYGVNNELGEVFSFFLSIVTIWLTFYIGYRQIKQNEEMEKLQRKIDERDEKRQ